MNNDYNQKEHLFSLIYEAFDNVKLQDGVSLHQTIAIDNYGVKDKAEQAKINADERDDWKKLIDAPALKEVNGIGGISFYDAKGLRFHLPAYMCLAVNKPEEDVADSLIFTLTNLSDYNKKRFSILNTKQRKAVKAFLQYIRHNTGRTYEFNHQAIETAIEAYWSGD